MNIIFFYVPVAGENDGALLGRKAIELKLAACVNVFPIQSLYFWQGAIQKDLESVLILKTLPEKANELSAFLTQHHHYDTPCILQFTAEVNEAYGRWMNEVMSRDRD